MSDALPKPAWIVALEARRDATIERIGRHVAADRELAAEKTLALEWCRAHGDPHKEPAP